MKLTNSISYKICKLIVAVTNFRHWIVFWAGSNQFLPKTPITWRSLLKQSHQRCHCLPNDLFSTRFPTTIEYNLCFPLMRATLGKNIYWVWINSSKRSLFLPNFSGFLAQQTCFFLWSRKNHSISDYSIVIFMCIDW